MTASESAQQPVSKAIEGKNGSVDGAHMSSDPVSKINIVSETEFDDFVHYSDHEEANDDGTSMFISDQTNSWRQWGESKAEISDFSVRLRAALRSGNEN